MVTRPIIEVLQLSKKYKLGQKASYVSLRDSLMNIFKWPAKHLNSNIFRPKSDTELSKDEFWVLKDISFTVNPGEAIGIIGRNGAGKTTLLKIFSKITYPTKGEVRMRGRVASLLEVGTGFHPELTGRENVYFNGSILGMKKAEIDRKFDEIVAFSEVEKFIDTPVKRYSSGMYVRLAFAVAAHLEPEILIIDEVLAVGDAGFQEKCLGKMNSVAKSGRTVLFVSHNMTAIKALCSKAILLENGQIAYNGDTTSAIERYMSSNICTDTQYVPLSERKRLETYSLLAKLMEITVFTEIGENPAFLDAKKPFKVRLKVYADSDNTRCSAQLIFADEMQNLIFLDSGTMHNKIYTLKKGINEIICAIGPLNLYAGSYKINCALTMPGQETMDYVTDAYHFSIPSFDPYNVGYNLQKSYGFGIYNVEHEWK